MGKWTQLKKNFPAAQLDSEYQGKVEAIKSDYLKTGVCASDESLKTQYVTLRNSKDRINQALAQINAELMACEQLFIEQFEARGTLNQKFEDGLTLYIKDDPTFKVVNPEEFYEWLEKDPSRKLEFPLTVHQATIQARLKDRLEQSEPLPPGTEVGYIKTSLGARGLPKG
jgi:hypothetical protein